MASNDLSCLGAIEGLRAAGRRVPEDVAAIGFDDIVDAWASTPTLTTVRHPTYAHGYQSVVTLLDRINGRAATSRTVVPTRLIVRESCGCELGMEPPGDPVFGAGLAPDSLDDSRLGRGNLQQQTTRALLEHMDMMSELGFLTARLRGTLEIDEIRDILAEHLPNLGVDHLLVARYDQRDDGNLDGTSEVLLSTGLPTAPRRRFRSRSFPSGVYPAGEPVQVVILPLRVDAHPIGFVALSAANLEAAAGIVSNVAAAIRSSRLYAEALEGRRLAEEASRLKSRFLSMVSHELRTPLSIIVGTSDLVLREARDAAAIPPHIVTDLERMTASAQHLGRLIGDVLDLASGEAGQLGLVRQPLDLGPLSRRGLRRHPAAGRRSGPRMADASSRTGALGTRRPDTIAAGPSQPPGQRHEVHRRGLHLAGRGGGRWTCPGTSPTRGSASRRRTRRPSSRSFSAATAAAARRGGLGLGLAIAGSSSSSTAARSSSDRSGDDGGGTTVTFTLPTIAGSSPSHCRRWTRRRVAGSSVALDAALLAAPLEDHALDRTWPTDDGGPRPRSSSSTMTRRSSRSRPGSSNARARRWRRTNGREALTLVEEVQPDLVLLDLGMARDGRLRARRSPSGEGSHAGPPDHRRHRSVAA